MQSKLHMGVFDRKSIPLPKLLVPENYNSIKTPFNGATSSIASSIRLNSGTKTLDRALLDGNRPNKPLIIYEYEASAPCRLVREACSILDLVVEYRPCPNERSGFSDLMATRTLGRRTVPFMIDDNPKVVKQELYTSERIIDYLFDTYGGGKENIPSFLKGQGALLSSRFASTLRGNSGNRVLAEARNENQFRKVIDLWGIEGDDKCRLVREALTALSLAHRMIYCAEGSINRAALEKKTGKSFNVPYLEDSNTNTKLFDADTIVKYLVAVYTTPK